MCARVVSLGGQRAQLTGKFDRLELYPNGTLAVLDYKVSAVGDLLPAAALAADLLTFLYYVPTRGTYPAHPHVVVAQLNLRTLVETVVDYPPAQRAANSRTAPCSSRSWPPARDRLARPTPAPGARCEAPGRSAAGWGSVA